MKRLVTLITLKKVKASYQQAIELEAKIHRELESLTLVLLNNFVKKIYGIKIKRTRLKV